MLEMNSISVTYGGALTALHDVDLKVGEGEVVAFLGANGAGKTTVLRAVSQNLKRHNAQISGGGLTFEGESLIGRSMSQIVERGIIQVPEGRQIFRKLTVDENLRIGGVRRKDRAALERTKRRVFELFPVLEERKSQPGTLLSGGEQQMLAIGRALMAGPRLLMLDEPSLGLAPKIVASIGEVLKEINADGMTIMLIEQNANMALSVSDRAYVLELGRVSLSGRSEDLMQSDDVKRLYLGHATVDDSVTTSMITVPQPLQRWVEER